MKHFIRTSAAIIIAAISVKCTSAQTISNASNKKASKLDVAIMQAVTPDLKSETPADVAAKDLQTRFTNIGQNIRWKKEHDGGYLASFANGEKKIIVSYDPDGDWNHTIFCYDAKELPQDVKQTVMKEYNNYNISYVDEINAPSKTIYLLCVQNTEKKIMVSYCNNEMHEIEERDRLFK